MAFSLCGCYPEKEVVVFVAFAEAYFGSYIVVVVSSEQPDSLVKCLIQKQQLDSLKKKMNGESSSRYDKWERMLQGGSSELHNVKLEDLRNITNDFSDERLLGKGGFGTVYKGVLKNGEMIAVKKFNSSMPTAKDRQFDNEANLLMMLKHPNVVLLKGWCSETENICMEYNGKQIFAEKSERLLCLEYMPKGNLRGYLSDEISGLGWDTRFKIIEGICYGLRYLHEECQTNAPIVHMDLKPANILLDNNMVPKIADFGLSRLFSEEQTWTCTISREGSLGYMSPEYINKGLISTKADIFSLGVIIIEIVTGRRDYPDASGTPSEEFIETVLNNCTRRRVGILFRDDYQQIRRCIQIGLDCVEIDRLRRPTISQIIKTLHKLEELPAGAEAIDTGVFGLGREDFLCLNSVQGGAAAPLTPCASAFVHGQGIADFSNIKQVLHNWNLRNMVEILIGHVSLQVDYQQIRRCIQIGLDCVKTDRFKRPTKSVAVMTSHRKRMRRSKIQCILGS